MLSRHFKLWLNTVSMFPGIATLKSELFQKTGK